MEQRRELVKGLSIYGATSVVAGIIIGTGIFVVPSLMLQQVGSPAGVIAVWNPPLWTRHIVVVLMWPASIMIAAAYIPGNIKRVLKHPMLAGVKTWAFAHLCANGDLGGIILFGAVLAWAVYDRITLKHRSDPGAPPIPVGGGKNDVIAIIVGTIIYLALGFVFHPIIIGVPAFGTPAFGQ